jgi:hypothetical protein
MDEEKTKEFCKELKELLDKYQVFLGVDIDGDTFGIQVRGFAVYDAKNKPTYLGDYSLYLNSYDLKLFLDEE